MKGPPYLPRFRIKPAMPRPDSRPSHPPQAHRQSRRPSTAFLARGPHPQLRCRKNFNSTYGTAPCRLLTDRVQDGPVNDKMGDQAINAVLERTGRRVREEAIRSCEVMSHPIIRTTTERLILQSPPNG